jgi:transposase
MGKPYSLDLRKRIAARVNSGRSRREAGEHFGVSESCAIKLMQRVTATGSLAPARQGRPTGTGKLAPYKDFLIGRVRAKPDLTHARARGRLARGPRRRRRSLRARAPALQSGPLI